MSQIKISGLDQELARLERKYGDQLDNFISKDYMGEVQHFYEELKRTYSEGVADTVVEALTEGVHRYNSDQSQKEAQITLNRAMFDLREYERLRLGGYPWDQTEELVTPEINQFAEQALQNFKQKDFATI